MSNNPEDIFNQNDDDIFQNSENTSQKISETIANRIAGENADFKIDTSDLLTKAGQVDSRARIVIALLEAAGNWGDTTHNTGLTKAVFHVLDEMTDNRFSKTYEFYRLEQNIIQQHVLLYVLEEMIVDDSDELKELVSALNVDITPTFVLTYIKTFHNILTHTLNNHIIVYQVLAKDLQIKPEESIINNKEEIASMYSVKAFVYSHVAKALNRNYISSKRKEYNL